MAYKVFKIKEWINKRKKILSFKEFLYKMIDKNNRINTALQNGLPLPPDCKFIKIDLDDDPYDDID